jgi:hypothetical protein
MKEKEQRTSAFSGRLTARAKAGRYAKFRNTKMIDDIFKISEDVRYFAIYFALDCTNPKNY